MFSSLNNASAGGGTPASSTRGRRRQRPTSNENSVQQPKAKRLRVPLNEQTFVNPEAAPETYEVKPARSAAVELRQDGVENSPSVNKKELSFRSKKAKTADRLNKGDGSVVLVRLLSF
jgi:nuclear pore complex protein Nup133